MKVGKVLLDGLFMLRISNNGVIEYAEKIGNLSHNSHDGNFQAKLVDNIKHRVTAIDDLASADEVADEELAEWEGSDTFLLVEWLARNGFAHTLRRVVENSKTGEHRKII